LFYRSHKDVRQLKDSLDLLRGRDGGVDGTVGTASLGLVMIVVAAAAAAAAATVMVAMAGVWVDGSSRHAREETVPTCAGSRGYLYYRCPTKDTFSYAHKRPSHAPAFV